MSGTLQHWAAALAVSLGIAGCSGAPADNAVTEAAHAGLNTMRAASVGHLQAGEARQFLSEHPDALVLDVRSTEEWNGEQGHIEGARQIPVAELGARLSEIESWKEKPVVVVGGGGAQGQSACSILTAAGFQQVMNLEGGMVAWHQGGD
jgi:rhodanese-related sulfurtransferase